MSPFFYHYKKLNTQYDVVPYSFRPFHPYNLKLIFKTVCFVWLVHADILIVEFHILIFCFLFVYLFLASFIFFYYLCTIALHLNLTLNQENTATTIKSLVKLCNACIVLWWHEKILCVWEVCLSIISHMWIPFVYFKNT